MQYRPYLPRGRPECLRAESFVACEPQQGNPFGLKPKNNADDNTRQLAELLKATAILESISADSISLQLLDKSAAFQFFSTWKSGHNSISFAEITALIAKWSRVQ